MLHFHPSCKHVFSIFLSHQTPRAPASLPTSEHVLGPVLIRKKCFAAVKRAESHPAATGNLAVPAGVRMPQTGSPWHCCHDRHGYYDFIKKKDGMPLIFAQLRWNDVQTTVNIWKLIAFDPKGPWKSFRKSHRYRGFVWNPARFDGMHDLVQMVNENYIEKP